MKTRKTRPNYAIISVRGLILIYSLLIILTVLFSRSFISDLLESGEVPGLSVLAGFFIIPAVLLVLLLSSGIGIARNIITREPGSRFQMRLLAYFFVVVLLAAVPLTTITSLSVSELISFWKTIDVDSAMSEAQNFAMETYSLKLEKLQIIADETAYGELDGVSDLSNDIIAVQEFKLRNEAWVDSGFLGEEEFGLLSLPSIGTSRQRGFIPRELPRDTDVIRYVIPLAPDLVRIVTLDLGAGFDSALRIIEDEKDRFEIIASIRFNIQRLLIFYYGVFFLPALLMTIIIALSFSRRVAYPIEELTEATRRVAEGDFSIRILPRKGDELALLVQSFNAMVVDLEKSKANLLNAEKINIWQDMAQRLAHEIKNPLTPIRLSAERVLRRWQNEPDKAGETGRIIESSMLAIIQEVEALSTLLGDFRTLSRPMEASETWSLLDELALDVIQPYSFSHPNVVFDTGHLGKDISLKIDRHRLNQILTNLIINAIGAMDGVGKIEIRTDLVKKEESSYCRLSIRDTGRGIPKENAGLVFSPYFTTKESGTGLGLPIIERIVNDHGGSIWFDSEEGAGTTFFIDLPLEKRN